MIFLLDTNAWIHASRRPGSGLAARLDTAAERGQVVISDLVRAELMEGACLSGQTDHDLAFLHDALAPHPSLPFDHRTADAYARTRAHLRLAGTPIGPIDTAIAATALVNRCTVVTHNRKHFDLVPGLAVEDWEAEESS